MLHTLGRRVKDFLWPMGRSCLLCGRPTRVQSLCADCLQDLKDCQLPPEEALHRRIPGADVVFCALHYGDAARRLVWLTKFDALEEAGLVLSYQLAAALQAYDITASLVTWVPMPPRRRRTRGIDHAQLLARETAQSLGIPCEGLLARAERTAREQHTLSRRERAENAAHAFCPVPHAPSLKGQRVMLIDDVLTTGATAAACVEQLRRMGAESVVVAAVCMTQMAG